MWQHKSISIRPRCYRSMYLRKNLNRKGKTRNAQKLQNKCLQIKLLSQRTQNRHNEYKTSHNNNSLLKYFENRYNFQHNLTRCKVWSSEYISRSVWWRYFTLDPNRTLCTYHIHMLTSRDHAIPCAYLQQVSRND